MTLEEFNNLKKGAIFYRISTYESLIMKYIVHKRKNKICYVNRFFDNLKLIFTYEDMENDYILYKDLIDYLNKIPKDNLVKILRNKSNDEILKDIKVHFVEYLI